MCQQTIAITPPYNLLAMTDFAIQKQLDAIKAVTEKALHSKETSLNLLIKAGIIKDPKAEILAPTTKGKNKIKRRC